MAIDDQLAALLAQNASLFATYEDWANGQVMLLAGTITDPDSFNAQGGKTGALGYYPVVNVSGQTIYVPCMDRLRHTAIDGVSDALDAVSIVGNGLLRSTGSINEELRLDVVAATPAETIAGTRSDAAVTPAGARAAIDQATAALAQTTKPQVSLLGSASALAFAATSDLVEIAGAEKPGLGVMDFVYDPAVNAAYVAANPYTSFRDKSGRGYRLTTTVVHARMFGVAENDSGRAAYNALRIQAAIDWCAKEVSTGTVSGYTLSFEGMGQVYHEPFVLKSGVMVFGGRRTGRGGRQGCCTLIPTNIPDYAFAITTPPVPAEKTKFFGIHGFYIKGGGAASLFAGILITNASDVCIDHIQMDNFGLQCIRAVAGVVHGHKNFLQGLMNRGAITTHSGTLELDGADHFWSGCEVSGPSQYSVSGPNLYCAALKNEAGDGSFDDCVFQTGDVGASYLGTRTRYGLCRFDTNAGPGINGIAGDRNTFGTCTWSRNGYSSLSNGRTVITGSIAGTTLTVETISENPVKLGDTIEILAGAGVNCVVTAFGTGSGGVGTYTVSVSQTVASGSSMIGQTLYDHIYIPSGSTATGRNVFTDPVFGSNGSKLRYAINDNRNSANFRNFYRTPSGDLPIAGFYNFTGYQDITIATGQALALPAGTTPSILNVSTFSTANTSPAAITGFTNGVPGQRITIIPADNFTSFVHGPSLALAQGGGSIQPALGGVPIEFILRAGVWRQIGGEGTAALARLSPVERASYDFTSYEAMRNSGVLVGTDTNADGLSDGFSLNGYGSNAGNTHTPSVANGRQIVDLVATGATPTGGRRLRATAATTVGKSYLLIVRQDGSTATTKYEAMLNGSSVIANVFTDTAGAAVAAYRFVASGPNSQVDIGFPAFGLAAAGSYRLSVRNILLFDLSAIEAATGYPASAQTDASLTALFLATLDRAPKVTGFTAGTGTANKGAFTTTNPMSILSATAPAAYSQSFAQSDRDTLTALLQALHNTNVALSQRVLALEQAIRTAGTIN